ncbi:hypothetical protein BDK51DRAFT_37139 [Blyttiomyces helicus]|uniref:Uncharacterized protein n=1 Tax=Blyttiomyces helicus TaxID=388810 RepID=A0A4P9W4W6_9FUNG|nr:hypothetical protein BDK51DRAFT_37139 [Blyttiomyces helicus]|eukprot:RKO87264.1 hypothetical protein BDK51DRAFT_37139 [Blyttiomyces helicus]
MKLTEKVKRGLTGEATDRSDFPRGLVCALITPAQPKKDILWIRRWMLLDLGARKQVVSLSKLPHARPLSLVHPLSGPLLLTQKWHDSSSAGASPHRHVKLGIQDTRRALICALLARKDATHHHIISRLDLDSTLTITRQSSWMMVSGGIIFAMRSPRFCSGVALRESAHGESGAEAVHLKRPSELATFAPVSRLIATFGLNAPEDADKISSSSFLSMRSYLPKGARAASRDL